MPRRAVEGRAQGRIWTGADRFPEGSLRLPEDGSDGHRPEGDGGQATETIQAARHPRSVRGTMPPVSNPHETCARLFAGDGERFVSRASRHLFFSGAQLRAWADRLDWTVLGANPHVAWTGELLAEFEDRFDWEVLSRSRGDWWTPELIEAHQARWSWEDLSRNPALPWSEQLLARYETRWNFAGVTSLGRNPGLPWSPELVERYEDRWRFKDLSKNPGLSWSPTLIEAYQDRWEWLALSSNPALPWSKELLVTFPDRWRWGRYGLSENFGFPWTAEFLREHAARLDWHGLSKNPALPWSEELLEEFSAKWLWIRGGLSGNPGLPWSPELVAKRADKLEFDGVYGLCDNTGVPWSPELLEDHAERWDWKRLSFNESLPWSLALLERFRDRWDRRALQLNNAVFPRLLLPDPVEFEVAYELVPDTPPAEDLAPKPVSNRVAQARGRQLRKALGARRTHASVKPWLQDAVRLDGPLVLLPYKRAAKRVTSMDGLFGRLGSKAFPALRVGGDRLGTEFWLVPATGAVISLHHDATFFELARDIRASSVKGFMKAFVARGSRLTWEQLLALQEGARERLAAGQEAEAAFGNALLAATGWSVSDLPQRLQHPALEFARVALGGLLEEGRLETLGR